MIKKVLVILGIITLLAILGVIWSIVKIKKSYKLLEQGTVKNFEGVVCVPLSYSSSGHIIVPIRFGEDTTSYPFIFDTGASNMLFEHFPYIHQFNKVGKSISLGAGGHFMLNDIFESSSIKFGGVNFDKQCFKVVSFDWPCWSEVYGIIGKGALRHLSWQIDFEKQMIYFSENIDDLNISEDAYKIELRENKFSHHLYFNLTSTYNQIRSVLFDTGYNGGLSLETKSDSFETSITDRISILGKQNKGLKGYSKGTEELVKFDTLFFNEVLFFKDIWAISSRSSMNIAGVDFLNHFLITFNWDDEILYLEQVSDSLVLNENRYGFTTTYSNGEVIISSVLEHSKAYEQGIRPKQKLISLNDKCFNSELEYCQFASSEYDSVLLVIQDTTFSEFEVKCFKENLDFIN